MTGEGKATLTSQGTSTAIQGKECAECGRTDKRLTRTVCVTCYARLRNQGRLGDLPVTSPGPGAKCKIAGCEVKTGRSGAKGYCPKHYQRLIKAQEGLAEPEKELPLADRFRAKVSVAGSCACGCACERWTAGKSASGYGHFSSGNKTLLAHRVAWELANGRPVPEGLLVDHVRDKGCVHTDCVRADHLEDVTYKENALRKRHNYESMSRGGRQGGANTVRRLSVRERFLLKVSSEPCPCGCACKRWTGTVSSKTGYGTFSVSNVTQMAHRVAWEQANGRPVPEGFHVDHVYGNGCRHRDCVNPAHLEAITPKENASRGAMGSRRAGRKATEHCDRILALLNTQGTLTVPEIRQRTGTSSSMTYGYLGRLLEEGKIVKEGNGLYSVA